MLLIRPMSDIHNEFGVLQLQLSEADKDRTLVLAGDIDCAKNLQRNYEWINGLGDYFRHVVYIPGNHEFYYGNYEEVIDFYKMVNWKSNVHFLHYDGINLDGVYLWAGTMWTGIKGGQDWGLMKRIQSGMNDFRLITRKAPLKSTTPGLNQPRHGDKWHPMDMVELFHENKPKLFEAVAKARAAGMPTVVVTHHAPASQSIARHYRGHDMNDAYCMYIDQEIMDKGPDLWIHGHTHVSQHYMCGKTRVICNPRGYVGYEENPEFNQHFVIDV